MGVRLLGKTGRLTTGTTLGSAVGTDEEDKNKQQQTTTGEAAFGGEGSAVKSVTQQAAPQTKGSGFTNVQKILKASGTDTGPSRLAQTAAGGVRQAASGAKQAGAEAVKGFQEGLTTASGAIPTSGSVSNIIQGAIRGEAPSEEDIKTYNQATSGVYSGPTSLQMTPEQQRKAAQSSALSKLAGDVSGRSALLQKYVGSPQYGQSKQTLDTLLLGKGGSAALRGALRQGARVEQDIRREEIVAQEQAKQAQERARGIAEEAKSGLEQAKTGLMGQLETTKSSIVDAMSGSIDRVLDALKQRRAIVSRRDLQILGLSENDFNGLKSAAKAGIDPTGYLTGRTTTQLKEYLQSLGKEQFASENERASLAALGRLAGQENLGLSNLGAAYGSQGLSSFDIQGFNQAINEKLVELAEADPVLKEIKKEAQGYGDKLKFDYYFMGSDEGSQMVNSLDPFKGYKTKDFNYLVDKINLNDQKSLDSAYKEISDWLYNNAPELRDGDRRMVGPSGGSATTAQNNFANKLLKNIINKKKALNSYERQYQGFINTPSGITFQD
jgi:hypothetical protein